MKNEPAMITEPMPTEASAPTGGVHEVVLQIPHEQLMGIGTFLAMILEQIDSAVSSAQAPAPMEEDPMAGLGAEIDAMGAPKK